MLFCYQSSFFCFLQIEPQKVVDIQFQKPKLGKDTKGCTTNHVPSKQHRILPPTEEDKQEFLSKVKQLVPSAAIVLSMDIVQQPSTAQPSVVRKLPPLLTSLYKSKYAKMSKQELEEECQKVFDQLTVTSEESVYLEESTRLQSKSMLWHQHRIGRITSSLFKRVKQTSIANPSMSLVNTIMQKSQFDPSKVPALHWGITHEDDARKAYIDLASDLHTDFEYFDSGLRVNPRFAHLGATPDRVVNYVCCGNGLIEIKCPYKHQNTHPHKVQDPNFYLKEDNEQFYLCTDHEYYFQIQGQLAVCSMEYCDFICWTTCGLHCERILADNHFFEQVKPALDNFFLSVLLPRLLTGSRSVTKRTAQAHLPGTFAGVMEKTKERWSGVTMMRVKGNGFTMNVWVFHANLEGNGFAQMTVEGLICFQNSLCNF